MKLLDEIVDFLYPPHCPKCKAYVKKRGEWCPECLRETAHVQRLPLPVKLAEAMDAAWAFGRYHGALRDLIRGLKYHGKKGNLPYLHMILRACEKAFPVFPGEVLAVPVPLHPAREKQRGFNQVELVFREWLMRHGIPMERLLLRTRQTKAQYGLSVQERQGNLKGAFAVVDRKLVQGKYILLLDDIMTTGSTFQACAEVLKAAGAARIFGLVLASDRG